MAEPQTDPVAAILLKAPPPLRASTWDVFHQAANEDDLAAKLETMPLAQSVKADLWDLKHQAAAISNAAPSPAATPAATVPRGPVTGRGTGFDPNVATRRAQTGAVALPTAGGVVGGMVGGPVGAGVGGAVGEGARQLVTGEGLSVPKIAKEGAIMAAGEGIGNLATKALGGAAKWLAHEALGPTLTLQREFPELAQTVIDHALTVSKGGLEKARDILHTAKATANAALDTATANGATVPLTAATQGLQKTFQEMAVNGSDPVGALNKLALIERRVGQGRAATLTMREADALKTSLQTEARSLYKQIQSGGGSRNAAIEMVAKADMAQALNQAIEQIATQAGAIGYKASNALAQDLIGATRAISRRILQPNGSVGKVAADLMTPGVLGAVVAGGPGAAAGAAGAAMVKAATLPSNMSRAAVYLSDPTVQSFLRQLPKPVLDAIGGMFGTASDQADSARTPPKQ